MIGFGALAGFVWSWARKVPVWAWVVAGLALGGYRLYRLYEHEKQLRTIAELQLVGQKELNDSTSARLAHTEVAKDSVGALLDAAKQLNGKLVAALKIHVAQRDTILVHVGDSLTIDSTRILTFKDSTFAGTIAGTVTAPPCCTPLRLEYRLIRPAFNPQVGFVRVDDRMVAVVSWAGEQVSITAPFAEQLKPRLGVLGGFVEGGWSPQLGWLGRGGFELRGPWHFAAQVGAFGGQGLSPAAYIGLRKSF